MTRKRKAHIPLREKLASALRHMKVEVDGELVDAIPYEHARKMDADQVIECFHFDHGIHEAVDGPVDHWNLTPRFIAEHRRKTAEKDIPQIAKTRRISKEQEEFRRRMLAKAGGIEPDQQTEQPKPKAKIKSRPFQEAPEGHKWFGRRGSTSSRKEDRR